MAAPTPPRPNGRMLTAKRLPKRAYDVVHNLPRGYRGPAMEALLLAAAALADKRKDWHLHARNFQLSIRKA